MERTCHPGSSGLYHQVSGSMPFIRLIGNALIAHFCLSLINHAVAFEILLVYVKVNTE